MRLWHPRPLQIVVVVGTLAILGVSVGIGAAIWQLRAHEIAQGKRELTTLDILLAEETERAVQSVDLLLKTLEEKLAADGVATAHDYVRTQSGRATYETLRARIIGIPQIDAVTLISAEGRLINFSRSYPIPPVNVADRDYFKALRDNPNSTFFLSEPVDNRANGTWTIYLARRVNGPKGEFIGLVLGAINLGYFENLYKSLQIGNGGAVSLWREDGTLLARFPTLPGIGHQFKIQSFTGILQAGIPVTYDVGTSIDGPARVVATVAAKQFPLVVNVTQTLDEILADWRPVAILMGFGGFIVVLACSIIMLLLARQFKTYEELSLAMAEREQAILGREQAEAQLRQAQKLEVVGQLTGGIAHDFNNLLTAVMGNLELLKMHSADDATRIQRWASNAFEAAKRGAMLTQRLLAFSRRQPLDPQPTDIALLLDSMSDLLRRTLGENVVIETRLEPDLWRAFVDLNQLDSAILNIAINARDAMAGHGKLTIEAGNTHLDAAYAATHQDVVSGDYVLVAMSDTGEGMARDVLDRVFEPFFTTKPIGQGTGLGLSQVYGFVKQTGGHIRVYSEPGHGTTIKIYLPRAQSIDGSHAQDKRPEEAPRAQESGVVLVVEDDADVRAYSVETLRDLGYKVFEAHNGDAALAILQRSPDILLLFTDVGLPGSLDGRALADRAKRLRPSLRVLFTTGYARDGIVQQGRLARGVHLIRKPFTRTELADKIRLVLDQQKPARATG